MMQSQFVEDASFGAGSVCFGYSVACTSFTEANGLCPAVSFDGAMVGVFGAFASVTACQQAMHNLTGTGLLATGIVRIETCVTAGCNTDAFMAAAPSLHAMATLLATTLVAALLALSV